MEPVAILHTDETGHVTNANTAAKRRMGATPGRRCTDLVALRDASGRAICTERCAASLATQPEGCRESHGMSRGAAVRVQCVSMGRGATILLQADPLPEVCLPLSPREFEVLALVAEGLTARRIAKRLGIKESTVRTHLDHAKEKLGARTLPEAASRLGRQPGVAAS